MKITIPMELPSLSNKRVNRWRDAERKHDQQGFVNLHIRSLGVDLSKYFKAGYSKVTLKRVGIKLLDKDNHVACYKHVQDQIGYMMQPEKAVTYIRKGKMIVNKGPCDDGIDWHYVQETGKTPALVVTLEKPDEKEKQA